MVNGSLHQLNGRNFYLSHAFVSKSRPKIQQDKVAKYNTNF